MSKKIIMVGFWNEELENLIQHLKNTQYNQVEIAHLESVLVKEND